ncbi:PilZ domain-containing protein [Sphingomonas sp. 28-63-12]|uniref:PilZ domain-containing protein n=1 Tax=Sphingomonas sp. 28-63-12 TaxID=1970434 RepID=UPI000BD8D3F8|nr:MAG: pilus assembly protein PilZ [Sphingomonas sp. 28-63-12]
MASVAFRDDRNAGRDEVHFRAKAFGPDAKPVAMVIVNMSAMGLMARCESQYQPGDRLSINLPVIGVVVAQIRWSLGGRIGCELDQAIDLADYYELLAIMLAAS